MKAMRWRNYIAGPRVTRVVRSLLVTAFSLIVCKSTSIGDTVSPQERASRLERFFNSYHCPSPRHTGDYLRAADAYHLDYRLLPAISVIESQCGFYPRLNNRWGWMSERGFSTVRAGIDFVSGRLAESYFYKDKTTDGKLRSYNPSPRYARLVKRLMAEIENLESAHD
jgi:hypothetical protein